MYRIGLLLLMLFTSLARGEWFAAPGGARLEGVGAIYGAGAGARGLMGERLSLIGGAAFGAVEAQGLLVSDVPVGLDRVGLMAGFANLSRARFNTAYARGLNSAPVFEQEIAGQAFGGGLEWRPNGRWNLALGLLQSTVTLEDYYFAGSRVERPNKGGYHDIETSSYFFNSKFASDNGDETQSGWNVGLVAVTADGRLAQSDTLTATYSLGGRWAVHSRVALVAQARWSDAYVTRQEKRYLTSAQTQTALNTNCASITDAESQAQCQALENSLAHYIAENNLHGTAAPLGGSGGVQAYDEFSLRAAHTRLLALETRVQLRPWLQLVPSYQIGWAADSTGDLFERSVHAYGAGLRVKVKSVAARLAYAQTHDQAAWFLTLER